MPRFTVSIRVEFDAPSDEARGVAQDFENAILSVDPDAHVKVYEPAMESPPARPEE